MKKLLTFLFKTPYGLLLVSCIVVIVLLSFSPNGVFDAGHGRNWYFFAIIPFALYISIFAGVMFYYAGKNAFNSIKMKINTWKKK